MRIGLGYDIHRLEKDRPLVLAGVTIEHPTVLLGHSDADVVFHALIDAILGATGQDVRTLDPSLARGDQLTIVPGPASLVKPSTDQAVKHPSAWPCVRQGDPASAPFQQIYVSPFTLVDRVPGVHGLRPDRRCLVLVAGALVPWVLALTLLALSPSHPRTNLDLVTS